MIEYREFDPINDCHFIKKTEKATTIRRLFGEPMAILRRPSKFVTFELSSDENSGSIEIKDNIRTSPKHKLENGNGIVISETKDFFIGGTKKQLERPIDEENILKSIDKGEYGNLPNCYRVVSLDELY